MRPLCATDLELARLATAQHGVVARQQMLVLGFSEGSVKRRVRGGRLHRVHHGIYAVAIGRSPSRAVGWLR